MVDEVHLEDAGDEDKLPRGSAIRLARPQLLGRMIVRDHDAVRIVEERALESLARLCCAHTYVAFAKFP